MALRFLDDDVASAGFLVLILVAVVLIIVAVILIIVAVVLILVTVILRDFAVLHSAGDGRNDGISLRHRRQILNERCAVR